MELSDATSKKLVKGAGVSFIGKLVSTGFKYFTQVVLAWLLGAEYFGLYTLGITIYHFGELFSRMGLDSGVVRYVSIYHGSGDTNRLKGVLLQAIGLPFLSGIVFGSTLFLTSDPIAQGLFGKPELARALRIFAIALPFGAATNVGAFATTGFQITQYKVYIWELLLPFINLLLAIVLCTIGFGLQGAALAWLVALALALAATVYFIGSIFPGIARRSPKPIFESKQLITFSLPLGFGTFAWLILLWTDVLMLGYFRSASEVGVYRAASQTSLLMNIIAGSLVTVFAPIIASLYSKGEFEEMGKVFQTSSRWSLSLTLPLFLIVGVAGKIILSIFGAEFETGWLPLVILGMGQLARAGVGGLSNHMLAMSGHQYLKLFADIGLAITNIALNIFLIPRWGVMGAAVATGVSITGISMLRAALVKRALGVGIRLYNWTYLKIIVAGTTAALIGLVVQNLLEPMHFVLSALFTALVICLCYFGLLLPMGIEEADQIILGKISKRLGLLKD